jgi:acyl-coenzyme A thioesterase PaaI-like protein
MNAAHESRSLRDAAAVDPLGPGHFATEISDDYTVVGHPNGGYLQCLLAKAALAAASNEGSAHEHATAITTSYVAAPEVGPVELRTTVRRVGRSVSFVHVELIQDAVVTTESLSPWARCPTTPLRATFNPRCRTWRRSRTAFVAPWSRRSSS